MFFLSRLEIITLTPYWAKRIAIAFPIPVLDAVMIATLPFIKYDIIVKTSKGTNDQKPHYFLYIFNSIFLFSTISSIYLNYTQPYAVEVTRYAV
jgi:uncharacterized membrane protein YwzB